jgi:hypothetical protein
LIPTILVGLPISVVSHSAHILFFIASILSTESANSRRSSTQTVMMAIVSSPEWVYMHGSACRHSYPHCLIFLTNSMFHLWPDCLSSYRVFIKWHTLPLPSLKPSGWCIYRVSFKVPFCYGLTH